MYVIIEHEISDPRAFWGAADGIDLPDELTLHQSLPSKDGTKAICVWEADSLMDVEAFVERAVGAWSRNTYYAVAEDKAFGLPGVLA